MPTRKSIRDLTDIEKQNFISAVWALKRESSTIISGVNSYDKYVVWHTRSMTNSTPWSGDDPADPSPTRRNSAHRGPAFLPWHREFLRQFELDLQRVSGNPNLGIPYWDWEIDGFFPDFLGGDGVPIQIQNQEPLLYFQAVLEGPFRFNQTQTSNGWLVANGTGTPIGPLQRTFGLANVVQRDSSGIPQLDPTGQPIMVSVTLPRQQDVQNVLAINLYDDAPWDEDGTLATFRNVLEGWWRGPRLHNQVHVWVGGSMGPGTSPNDPAFFLHHCNIDRIWALWQQKNPTAEYQPQTGGPPGHNLNDPMFPWDGVATTDIVKPTDVLSLGNVNYAPPP